MEAEQTVLNITGAASAANNLDMEIEDSYPAEMDLGRIPDQELTDYNEYDPNGEDPIPALKKSNNGKEAVSPMIGRSKN